AFVGRRIQEGDMAAILTRDTRPWRHDTQNQRRSRAGETDSVHPRGDYCTNGGPAMSTTTHLWAIGYDDMARADQVRDEIIELGWGAGKAAKYLILADIAVVVRHPDGSFTFDRKPFPGLANILASTGVGFLAGLVLAAPLTGATIGAVLGSAGSAAVSHAGI